MISELPSAQCARPLSSRSSSSCRSHWALARTRRCSRSSTACCCEPFPSKAPTGAPRTDYIPLAQRTPDSGFFQFATLSVRAQSGSPLSLARGVGGAIARVDSDVAITFTALKQQVDAALVQERIVAMLSGWFSVLALLLSALGLYGVSAAPPVPQRQGAAA